MKIKRNLAMHFNSLIDNRFKGDKFLKRYVECIPAFTLAEVLITLGILGIVASITMPTLIGNHKKVVYVNSLKKELSSFEQGMRRLMADEGVDNLKHLSMFDDYGACYQSHSGRNNGDQIMKKYFKVLKIVDDILYVKTLDSQLGYNEDVVTIYMADGSKYMIDGCFSDSWFAAYVMIDTNGDRLPNQLGRDVFAYALNSQGFMMPYNGKKFSELFGPNSYWKNNNSCSSTGYRSGEGCAARLMENGWKMDY